MKLLLAVICVFLFLPTPVYSIINYQSYWQDYGPAKIVKSQDYYKDLNINLPCKTSNFDVNNSSNIIESIKILVASNDMTVLKAINKIFSDNPIFSRAKLDFISYNNNKLSSQILGLDNAEKIAIKQISQVLLEYKKDYKNSIPSFICSVQDFFTGPEVYTPRGHVLVIIQDSKYNIYRYVSDGIEIAPEIYEQALDSEKNIGELLSELYNVDSQDWHQFVTQSKTNRLNHILSAFENNRF